MVSEVHLPLRLVPGSDKHYPQITQITQISKPVRKQLPGSNHLRLPPMPLNLWNLRNLRIAFFRCHGLVFTMANENSEMPNEKC